MKESNRTRVNYDHLRKLVNEMEHGVAATTRYTWLDLAHEVLRLHDGVKLQRDACASVTSACESMGTPEARAVSGNMESVARGLSDLLENRV